LVKSLIWTVLGLNRYHDENHMARHLARHGAFTWALV
jgi:hypothetical protein